MARDVPSTEVLALHAERVARDRHGAEFPIGGRGDSMSLEWSGDGRMSLTANRRSGEIDLRLPGPDDVEVWIRTAAIEDAGAMRCLAEAVCGTMAAWTPPYGSPFREAVDPDPDAAMAASVRAVDGHWDRACNAQLRDALAEGERGYPRTLSKEKGEIWLGVTRETPDVNLEASALFGCDRETGQTVCGLFREWGDCANVRRITGKTITERAFERVALIADRPAWRDAGQELAFALMMAGWLAAARREAQRAERIAAGGLEAFGAAPMGAAG